MDITQATPDMTAGQPPANPQPDQPPAIPVGPDQTPAVPPQTQEQPPQQPAATPQAPAAPQPQAAPVNASAEPSTAVNPEPLSVNPSKDDLLQKYVNQDLIPDHGDILNGLRTGDLQLEDVMAGWDKFKKDAKNKIVDQEGNVTTKAAVAVAQQDTSMLGEMKDNVIENIGKAWDQNIYVAQQFSSGVSLNTVMPTETIQLTNQIGGTPFTLIDPVTKYVGTMANLIGMGLGAAAATLVASTLPVVGPVVEAIGEAKEALQAAEPASGIVSKLGWHAKSILANQPELAGIGAVNVAGSGLIKGRPIGDILTDIPMGMMEFMIGGAALHVPMVAAGEVVTKFGPRMGNAATAYLGDYAKYFGGTDNMSAADRAANATQLLRNYLPEVINADTMDEKIMSYEKIKTDHPDLMTEESERHLNALYKVKALGVTSGPVSEAEAVEGANAVKYIKNKESKEFCQKVYQDDNGELNGLYKNSPALQNLIENGKYEDAALMSQDLFRNSIKENQTLKDLIMQPYMNDTNSVGDYFAARIKYKTDASNMPDGLDQLITDYGNNPTEQGLSDMTDALKGKSPAKTLKSIFGINPKRLLTEGDEAFVDVRLNPKDASTVADQMLKNIFDAASKDKVMKFGKMIDTRDGTELTSYSLPKDTNDLIKATATYNKQYVQTALQAYNRPDFVGPMFSVTDGVVVDKDNNWGHVDSDMSKKIQSQINLNRLSFENAFEINKNAAIKTRISKAYDDLNNETDLAKKNDIQKQLDKLKTDQVNSTAALAAHSREIIGEGNTLSALDPAEQKQIAATVADMYKTKSNSYASMQSFGMKDNPFYMKDDTETADFIHASSISKGDTNFDISPTRNSFSLLDIERRWEGEYGYNNPLSQFANTTRQRMMMVENEADRIIGELKQTGITKDNEDKILRDYIRKKITTSSPEFLALDAPAQARILESAPKVQAITDDIFKNINAVRRYCNLPEVAYKEDYVTAFHKNMVDLQQITDKLSNDLPLSIKDKDGNIVSTLDSGRLYKMEQQVSDPTRMQFGHEFHQGEAKDPDDQLGAIQAISKYAKPALNQIYMTDLVRKLDAMRAISPPRLGENLTIFKNKMMGMPGDTDSKWRGLAQVLAQKGGQATTKANIAGNVGLVVKRLGTSLFDAALHPKDYMTALAKWGTEEHQDFVARSTAVGLRKRFEGIDLTNPYDEMFKKIPLLPEGVSDKVNEILQNWPKWTMAAFTTADRTVTELSAFAADQRALRAGITNPDMRQAYSDRTANKMHASFASIDSPDFHDSILGRTVGRFQTFANNMGSILIHDLPLMAQKEGASTAINTLMRGAVAAHLQNEIAARLGMPHIVDWTSFVPFASQLTSMKNVPTKTLPIPAIQAIQGAVNIAKAGQTTNEKDKLVGKTRSAQALEELLNVGPSIAGISGGGQMVKTGKAIFNYKDQMHKLRSVDRPKAYIFGPSAVKYNETEKAAGPSSLERTEKNIKRGLGRLLGR